MNEPSVLTRMRLSCCWGDNLNEKELNEVVDYINHLQRENQQLKTKNQQLKSTLEEIRECIMQPNIEIREYYSCDMDYSYVNEKLLQIIDKGIQ